MLSSISYFFFFRFQDSRSSPLAFLPYNQSSKNSFVPQLFALSGSFLLFSTSTSTSGPSFSISAALATLAYVPSVPSDAFPHLFKCWQDACVTMGVSFSWFHFSLSQTVFHACFFSVPHSPSLFFFFRDGLWSGPKFIVGCFFPSVLFLLVSFGSVPQLAWSELFLRSFFFTCLREW